MQPAGCRVKKEREDQRDKDNRYDRPGGPDTKDNDYNKGKAEQDALGA